MISLEQIKKLAIPSASRIVMLVIDGLGGLPDPKTGKTELGTAITPNLDRLAEEGICGLVDIVSPGITPGSAPGHLALFGYDPLKFSIGRGILETLGIDFGLKKGDIAARGNFCTIDEERLVTDRRAGRIPTERCAQLCEILSHTRLDDIQLFVLPVREHRFSLVLRGGELSAKLSDSDPQQTGVFPNIVAATNPRAERTARLVNQFIDRAREILPQHYPANMILLRVFSQLPEIPAFNDTYKLKSAAIATYPMYKGIAKLLGMKVLGGANSIKEELTTLARHYAEYNFFFVHIKQTDAAGEDGDFSRKVKVIEEIDVALPPLLSLKPEVIVVTGDHSTPALLKGHSWHPVPLLLHSQWCRPDAAKEFSERACASGGLGRFSALDIMPLAMANALKLTKFGA